MKNLPTPPQITFTEGEVQILPETGFLKIKRSDLTFHYPDGTSSEPFTVDRMFRGTDDAVGVMAWFRTGLTPHIYLRSAVRPALSLRDYSVTGVKEPRDIGNLWEMPAGGIEKTEKGQAGVLLAASREVQEELGFTLPPNKFKFLGKRTFLDVGSSGTRMFILHIEVDPSTRIPPNGDGSPMERCGEVVSIPLKEALDAINDGYIIDSYTEIGIRRLVDLLRV